MVLDSGVAPNVTTRPRQSELLGSLARLVIRRDSCAHGRWLQLQFERAIAVAKRFLTVYKLAHASLPLRWLTLTLPSHHHCEMEVNFPSN